MAESVKQLKGVDSDSMDISGEESSETGFLQDIVNVDTFDQSNESLNDSNHETLFGLNQSNPLQRSQGFCFTGISQPNTGVTSAFSFSERSLPSSGMTPGPSSLFLTTAQGVENNSSDMKPVFISSGVDFATFAQSVGTINKNFETNSVRNQDQVVFDTNAFLMSMQNSNPGFVGFCQQLGNSGAFKSDNVFTFGKDTETSQMNQNSSASSVEPSENNSQVEGKGSRTKLSSKHRPRKSRSLSSSSENVQKTEQQLSSSPSQLETTELTGTGELGFKPSLLDEILTEKKMALMRSPEVMQFLQSQQKKITHGQYTES